MSYSAAAVANEILSLGRQETIPIDQLKLQKLIFYSHAWNLAENRGPLIEEEVEAWAWGPVVRSIYCQTLRCGRAPIGQEMTALDKAGDDPLDWKVVVPRLNGGDENAKALIKEVWDVHKAFTGIQLSNSTHAAGEPWTIVKNQYGSLEKKPPIPNALIKAVFQKKLENADNQTAG